MVTPMELIACGETLQKFSTFPGIIEGSVTKHDQHHQISSTSIPNRLHETLLKNSLKEFVGSRQTVLIRDKSSSNTSSESSLDAIGHVETFQNQMFETNIETIQDIQYKHLDMISKSISTSCSTLSMNHSMETIQIEQIIRLKQSRSMNGSKSSNTYKRQKIPLAIAGESRLRSCSSSVCKKIHCHQCGKSKTRCVCKI
ncbi:hypothetical protein HDV02_002538 [Globomyces sp. JEL0801]|nr:hypothetical protein HDV02_002538 [Globomyces sp. JEL0801]